MTVNTAVPASVERISLGIITERTPVSGNRWIDERWTVVGAVAGGSEPATSVPKTLRSGPGGERYLWTGLHLRLTPPEADAYYHNLAGTNPRLYVYCQRGPDGGLVPVDVTLDYIEAMAHNEFGNEVYPVSIPPEIYRRIEHYVMANYVPEEPRVRRKPGEPGNGEGRGGGGCG